MELKSKRLGAFSEIPLLMDSDKPNNKLAHGFARYISNMATGYFMGKGIRYGLKDEDYKSLLTDILDHNYTDNTNFELAKEASKKGIAYEILYIDEKSRLRTKKLTAEEVIPVYSPALGEFLECAIRIWSQKGFDDTETVEHAELYTDKEILTYIKKASDREYALIETRPHNLDDIPIVVYWNNEERTGDYENVISLIDAYDKAQSDTANDNEYFTDAYLLIIGAGGGLDLGGGDEENDEDTRKAYSTMRKERVLHLDEKGQAQWLVKEINDAAQENYKNRIYNDIFFLAQVPALTDESFSGNLTGVAIRYKLIGLEELAIMKENKFLSAQKKKIRIITDFINKKHNKNFDADTVEVKAERNFIDNLSEIIDNVEKLHRIISNETLLGMLPFIKDVNKELERIYKEQLESEGLAKIDKSIFDDEDE